MRCQWTRRLFVAAACLLATAGHAATIDRAPFRIDRPVTGLNGSQDGFATSILRLEDGVVLVSAPSDRFDESGSRGSVYAFRREDSSWRMAGVLSPVESGGCGFGERLVGRGNHAFTDAAASNCTTFDATRVFRIDVAADGVPFIAASTVVAVDGVPHSVDGMDSDGQHLAVSAAATVGGVFALRVLVFDTALSPDAAHAVPPAETGYFIGPVAIDGDRLAASCQRDAGDAPSRCVHLFERAAQSGAWTHVATIDPPSGVEPESFAASLRFDGERLLVGVPGLRGDGQHVPGRVIEFSRAGGQWVPASSLEPANGLAGDGFGGRITLDNDELVVFAPQRAAGTDRREGALYRYCRDGGGWQPCGFIEAAAGDEDWPRPESVAVLDDELLFGQPYFFNPDDGTAGSVGRVERDDAFAPIGRFHPGDGGSDMEGFGSAVATAGDLLVVGAPGFQRRGAVLVYRRRAGQWQLEHIERATRSGPNCPGFGSAVATRGTGFVVTDGCPDADHEAQGYLHFFSQDPDGQWFASRTERIPAQPDQLGFGHSVLLTDHGIVYGAPAATAAGVEAAGAVHILQFIALGSVRTTLVGAPVQWSGRFGSRLAATRTAGQTLLAVGNDAPSGGNVQLFAWDGVLNGTPPTAVGALAPGDVDPQSHFGASLALDANALLVGAPDALCPAGQYWRPGAVYRYGRVDGVWALQQRICPDAEVFDGRFGTDVALLRDSAIVATGLDGGSLIELDRRSTTWTERVRRSGMLDPGGWLRLASSAQTLVAATPYALQPATFNHTGAVLVFDGTGVFGDDFE